MKEIPDSVFFQFGVGGPGEGERGGREKRESRAEGGMEGDREGKGEKAKERWREGGRQRERTGQAKVL